MRFKVRNLKTGSELEVIASRQNPMPGTWHIRNIKAQIGEPVLVENGLGLQFKADRVPLKDQQPLPPLQRRIGQALKAAREANGLTQEALAGKLGSSVHYIRSVEQGQKNPTLLQLQRLVVATCAQSFDIVIF